MVRSGRRSGDSGTRDAILEAARSAFARSGYDGATIRAIAGGAGVDPALVHHYFGAKEQLFVAAMRFPIDPSLVVAPLVAGGVDGLGERLARFFVTIWEDEERIRPFIGMLRSAVSSESAAAMLREFLSAAILSRLVTAIGADRPLFRASMCGSQLIGIAMARYVVKIPGLVDVPPEELIRAAGPTLQRYLTGDL